MVVALFRMPYILLTLINYLCSIYISASGTSIDGSIY